MKKRPVQPVAPCALEFIFYYACPHCGHKNATLAPTQPAMAQCESCGKGFPLIPVDEHTVRFLRIMLAEGRAAVDPDFV